MTTGGDANEPLSESERAWVEAHLERCWDCGHLLIAHNEYCCPFCTVDGCKCPR